MKKVLRVSNLKKYYSLDQNQVKAVDDVSFHVDEGEFLGIMGPSGSGKSTLLNVISTITGITDGQVYIDEKSIGDMNTREITKFRGEKLGFIFQEFNLINTLNLYDNMAIALTINKYPSTDIREEVERTARLMGIEDILTKYPHEVSGGQKQRCACARAIITSPRLLLADEPTGALDSGNARKLMEHLTHMNKKAGSSILMVTHDVFTASYCSRILFMKDGKLFKEIFREDKKRGDFLEEILSVISSMGGEEVDICENSH